MTPTHPALAPRLVPQERPAAVPAADPMAPRRFRIDRVVREVEDTFTWWLSPLDGEGFAFRPGQFNMLYLFGVGEVAISISGDPRQDGRLVHTIRRAGNVTTAMKRLKAGAVVGVRGPFGTPWPVDEVVGQDLLFVTGTIGLAPLRPLIYEVLHRRGEFGRVVLCYGSRGTGDILYRRLLQRWRGRFDMDVQVTVHTAPAGYGGTVGSVARLVERAAIDPEHTCAFVCRSETMTRKAVDAINARGIPDQRIYVTLERNMKCAVGFCGHCQFGGSFMCKDGPVYRFDRIAERFAVREL